MEGYEGKNNCQSCGNLITKHYWFNPFTTPYAMKQCSRWWCRLRSGHYQWQQRFKWITWKIKIPVLK